MIAKVSLITFLAFVVLTVAPAPGPDRPLDVKMSKVFLNECELTPGGAGVVQPNIRGTYMDYCTGKTKRGYSGEQGQVLHRIFEMVVMNGVKAVCCLGAESDAVFDYLRPGAARPAPIRDVLPANANPASSFPSGGATTNEPKAPLRTSRRGGKSTGNKTPIANFLSFCQDKRKGATIAHNSCAQGMRAIGQVSVGAGALVCCQ